MAYENLSDDNGPKPPPIPSAEEAQAKAAVSPADEQNTDVVEPVMAPREHHAQRNSGPGQARDLLPLQEVAEQVAMGEWGEGRDMMTRLRREGYNVLKVVAESRRISSGILSDLEVA